MQYLKYLWLACTALLFSNLAYAEAPFIDYQWTISPDACLDRAKSALKNQGFKSTSAGNSEAVGQKSDYKGVIACVGEEASVAVFMVAGPDYKQAKQFAVGLKKSFLKD